MARRAPAPLLLLAAAVVPLFRQRGNPSWDSLWAEDGFLLYQDVLDHGPVAPISESYAGYLVLAPRLLAMPLHWIEPRGVAAWCAIAATAFTAVLAGLTYRWTEGWIRSVPVRLTLAGLVVLMPAAGVENTAVLVNIIWALICVAPWAVLARHDGKLDVAARAAVLFLAVTSIPVPLVFLPPALLWAWRERRRPAVLVVTGAFVAGALLQLVVMAVADDLVLDDPQRPADEITRLLLVRLFGVALVGPEEAVGLWQDHGAVTGVLAAAVVVAIIGALAWRARRREQVLGVGFALAGLVVLFGLVWSRGTLPFRYGGEFNLAAHMRYSVPAVFLLASGVAVLAGNRPAGPPGRWRRLAAPLFVAHAAVLVVLSFPEDGLRGGGPTWGEHLQAAAGECPASPSPGDEVVVPQDAVPFWGVRIPCDRLR